MNRLVALRSHLRLRRFSLTGSILVLLFLVVTPLGTSLELACLSLALRLSASPPGPPPLTLVVLRGLSPYGELPILREELAGLLETLQHNKLPGTAPVLIDMVLSEPTSHTGPTSAGARIIAATQALGNVVNAGILAWNDTTLHGEADELSTLTEHSMEAQPVSWALPTMQGTLLAHPSIAPDLYAASAGVGFINVDPSQSVGDVILHLPLLARGVTTSTPMSSPHERFYPALALAGLAAKLCPGQPFQKCVSLSPTGLRLGNEGKLEVPLDENAQLWIRPRARFELRTTASQLSPPAHGAIPDVVYFRMEKGSGHFYTRSSSPDDTTAQSFNPEKLRGQMLMVVDGQESSALHSPLGPTYPQASVHAQLISNVLERDMLQVLPPAYGVAWGVLVVMLAFLLSLLLPWQRAGRSEAPPPGHPPKRTWAHRLPIPLPELLLLGLSLLMTLLAFWLQHTWLPVGQPIVALGMHALLLQLSLPRVLEAELASRAHELSSRQAHELKLKQEAEGLEDALSKLQAELQGRLADLAAHQSELQTQSATLETQKSYLEKLAPLEQERHILEGLGPEERTALTIAPVELSALEGLIDHVQALLEGDFMPSADLTSATGLKLSGALKPLSDAAHRLRELRDQVRTSQRKLERELPVMSNYLSWYRARSEAHHTHIRRVHDAFRITREQLLAVAGEVEQATLPATPSFNQSLHARTGMISADPDLCREVLRVIAGRADDDDPVLILGETGTGKELLAKAIHQAGKRAARPILTLNCGAFTEDLLASELFGHVKGAFTAHRSSAAQRKVGCGSNRRAAGG